MMDTITIFCPAYNEETCLKRAVETGNHYGKRDKNGH